MDLEEIMEKLKRFTSPQARADAIHKCIKRGILSLEDLKNVKIKESIIKGIEFFKETTFREDDKYHEIITTDSYALPGGKTIFSVDVNEWGENVGYKEMGKMGTVRSLEKSDDYTKTMEGGPIQNSSKERVGRYRREIEEGNNGNKRRNYYDYDVNGEDLQVEEVILEENGRKEYVKMVNGIPSFAVQMQGDDVALVQYTKTGEVLATYSYDAKTGLPKDYDPNIKGYRKFPGVDKLQIGDMDYAFEDIVATQALQDRLLSPEARQVIAQSECIPFAPNKNLDKLKESLGMETSQQKNKANNYEH